jgi:hypothetical protein
MRSVPGCRGHRPQTHRVLGPAVRVEHPVDLVGQARLERPVAGVRSGGSSQSDEHEGEYCIEHEHLAPGFLLPVAAAVVGTPTRIEVP